MGINTHDKKCAWRISRLNADYVFSPTYPAVFPVPSLISDITLKHAGRYRSRARVPALTYLHPVNNCSITRCSQPMLGVRQNRSIQDETLLAEIFGTTRNERPLSAVGGSGVGSPVPEMGEQGSGKENVVMPADAELVKNNPEALEDALIASVRVVEEDGEADEEKGPRIYGAQQRNMIIDARPTVNAYVMQAAGMGSENMDNYKFATKAYLGIDNIHVMRSSLEKVVDALKDSDLTPLGPNKETLARSHWLKHIANMLDGVGLITRQVGLQHSHVLIHCSDGWDRTSQLSALAQICLDPYYRTIEGFIVLVEKDWLSFGHRFQHRSGYLSHEKWFQIENERIGGSRSIDDVEDEKSGKDAISRAQGTFENAFLSAKGFFTKHNNDSRDSINVDSENDTETAPLGGRRVSGAAAAKEDKSATKTKETAPIFHQFLDATYQLLYQYPTRFEFTERFLRRLLYHLFSCQYGTFLLDNEKARKDAKLSERTKSVWDYFLSRRKEFLNPKYDAEVDDNVRGRERLIFPRIDEVRWWNEIFGRTDEEMNGKPFKMQVNGASDGESEMSSYGMQSQISASVPVSRARTPVLTGVETSEASVGVASPPKADLAVEATAEAPTAASAPAETQSAKAEEVIGADSESTSDEPAKAELPVQSIDSAPEQENVQEDVAQALADDMDPLGIGDVQDRVPDASKKAHLEKRRHQMEMLLQ